MKKFLLIVCLSISSLSVCASSDSFIARFAKKAKKHVLHTLISERCFRYLPVHQQFDCQTAVRANLDLLDYEIIPQGKGFFFVAFKTDLVKLLQDPKTTDYLTGLQEELNGHLLAPVDFNIWEYTLKHYGTKAAAARVLAVLFQDTSPGKLHMLYLDHAQIPPKGAFEENRVLLIEALSLIDLAKDLGLNNTAEIFYPREFSTISNKNIYHFYVPLYLSWKLKRVGTSRKMSFIAPLLLTLTYEFITSSKDPRYFLKDPKQVDDADKVRDIYAGYSGAYFGIWNQAPLFDHEELVLLFARSTRLGVEQLLFLD